MTIDNCINVTFHKHSRLDWIDKAKAFGIFLVAYGHILQHCNFPGSTSVYNLIYGFHMPLFFFLSGITYKDQKSLFSFVLKKAKTILLPAYLFICLHTLWEMVTGNRLSSFGQVFDLIFYTTRSPLVQPYWFLGALFLCECTYAFLRRAARIFTKRLWLIGVFVVIFYFLTCAQKLTTDLCLPFCAENIGFALPFFMLGVFMYTKKEQLLRLIIRKEVLCICIFMSFALLYVDNHTVNYRNGMIGNPVIALLKGICGIQVISYISMHLPNAHSFDKAVCQPEILVRTGRNSLYIYGLHYIGFLDLAGYLLDIITIPAGQILISLVLCTLIIIVIDFIMQCAFFAIAAKSKQTISE